MAEPTWSWGGLMKGDPYGTGAGKPLPAGVTPPPSAAPGSQLNPFSRQGQGGPGDWWRGSRKGQFGFPQPQQLPGNIGDIRQQMFKFEQSPSSWQSEFNQMNPGFSEMWQGVFNAPESGDFNVGPQMASVPLGEGAGPSAPWAGWQPAQAEDWSSYG